VEEFKVFARPVSEQQDQSQTAKQQQQDALPDL
jgi:hypothetical protein